MNKETNNQETSYKSRVEFDTEDRSYVWNVSTAELLKVLDKLIEVLGAPDEELL